MEKIKKIKKILLLTSIILFLGIILSNQAQAGTDDNVYGWAWSGNIGWVSFNCHNDYNGDGDRESHCAGEGYLDYGVNINSDGTVSGEAWSENIGWIKIDPAPDADTGLYPEIPQSSARIDLVTGELSGWVRACAGTVNGDCLSSTRSDGWDGWIKLRGQASDGSSYGVSLNFAEKKFEGWAWGSEVVGWLTFNCADGGWSALSDDPACGIIDCSGWYVQEGAESPSATEFCYHKQNITSDRCEGIEDCKDANSTDCDSQPNDTSNPEYSCDTCCYIDDSVCTETIRGTGCSIYGSSWQGPTPDSACYDVGPDSPEGTNYCKHQDWHCSGVDCSETYDEITDAACGLCQYCDGCSCAPYPDGTSCGGNNVCQGGVCVSPALPPLKVLNSASGKSCNTICAENGGTCLSVGLNEGADNGQYAWRCLIGGSCGLEQCMTPSGGCGTVMSDIWGYNKCGGIDTRWTYCLCQISE